MSHLAESAFFIIIGSLICFSSTSVNAKTCGDSFPRSPHNTTPGCERLQVVVHNDTNYTFKLDPTYTLAAQSGGPSLGVGFFDDIPANSTKTFIFDGVYVNNNSRDKVDTSMRFLAYLGNQKIGPRITIYAQKESCNVANNAEIIFYDQRCYDDVKVCVPGLGCSETCTLNTKCFTGCCSEGHKDCVCTTSYAYKTTHCSVGDLYTVNNPAVPSSVQSDSGIFTIGAKFDLNGVNIGEDSGHPYGVYTHFTCKKETECGDTKSGNCISGTATNDDNKPAKLEFYIKPSPIETLTIKLPFDPKTPTAKLLQGSIYNNLNAEYLGRLGSYFSYQPVVMTDQEIAFSTLCNSASCPGT